MEKEVEDKVKTDLIQTGVLFERKVYDLFNQWGQERKFVVDREYPYSYQFFNDRIDGSVDILATTGVGVDFGSAFDLTFAIECKKADPKLKHWVFEPHRPTKVTQKLPILERTHDKSVNYRFEYILPSLGYNIETDYENAVNVFEFSKEDGRIRRQPDREMRAFYSLQQVNASINGVVDKSAEIAPHPNLSNLIIPIVVTTANLWVAEYNSDDVGMSSAHIDLDKVLLKPQSWVTYAFPLQGSQLIPGFTKGEHLNPYKRLTFVVNSDSLKEFLSALIDDLKEYQST